MPSYLVNKEPGDSTEHEVHTTTCNQGPDPKNQQHLGTFDNCHEALEAARMYFDNVDGCAYCCPECHTQ